MLLLLLPYCCQAPTAAPGPFLWRVSCSSMAIRRADERTRTADLISLRVRFGLLYLRACADRSWPARRSALPAVAAPSFPDEPTHDDDHLGESYPEVDHLPTPLGTPHKLLLWASFACQELVLSTTQRFVAVSGAGLPFWAISASSPRSSSRSRVVSES